MKNNTSSYDIGQIRILNKIENVIRAKISYYEEQIELDKTYVLNQNEQVRQYKNRYEQLKKRNHKNEKMLTLLKYLIIMVVVFIISSIAIVNLFSLVLPVSIIVLGILGVSSLSLVPLLTKIELKKLDSFYKKVENDYYNISSIEENISESVKRQLHNQKYLNKYQEILNDTLQYKSLCENNLLAPYEVNELRDTIQDITLNNNLVLEYQKKYPKK